MKTKQITLAFWRVFIRGDLKGLDHLDRITHVDRWHAAQWVKGVRANTRRGNLDYRLKAIWIEEPITERQIADAVKDMTAKHQALWKGAA